MKCVLCNNTTSIFDRSKGKGKICKNCMSFLPTTVILSSDIWGLEELKETIKEHRKKAELFDATADYGIAHIDHPHKMISIYKNPLDKGKDIYHISELTNIAISCVNARIYRQRLLCNIVLTIDTEKSNFKKIIKYSESCEYKGGSTEWSEPPLTGMFRNMINAMIKDETEYQLKRLKMAKNAADEMNVEYDRGVLMLDKDFTREELKEHRNFLIKRLHPDNSISDMDYAEKINRSYERLKNNNESSLY